MALYNFLTGKIRVLEKNLLNQTDVDRMVDAPDFDAAFKALNDTDYGAHLLGLEADQFKEALDSDVSRVRDLMVQWIEQSELLEFMFLQYDAHNIKLYLKTQFQAEGVKTEHVDMYSSATGLTAPHLIKQSTVEGQTDTVLHPITDQLLKTVVARLGNEPTGFKIDSIVDLVMFEILDERIKNISGRIIQNLYTIQKETSWVKTFLRAKRLNKPVQELTNILPDSFLRHYELDEIQALEALSLDPKIRNAYKDYLDHNQLWKLEKDLEEAELSVIRDAKLKTTGPEPIVGYFYGKKNAVRNVRLILTAKQNEIAVEKIKERVRDLY